MSIRSRVIICLLSGLLVCLGYFVFSQLERYTRYKDSAMNIDALLNPWLAAQRFLEKQSIPSHRGFNLFPILEKLEPEDILVLNNSGPILNDALEKRLMEWMNKGGHLVMNATREWDAETANNPDPFLEALGIVLWQPEQETPDTDEGSDSNKEADTEKDAQQSALCEADAFSHQHWIAWENELIQIKAPADFDLAYSEELDVTTSGYWPNVFVQRVVGQGKLTVMLDTGIWSNDQIAQLDHAYLLWRLSDGHDTVWFAQANGSESLLEMLQRTAPWLLLSVLLLILVWVWQKSIRFGPLLPSPSGSERKITEHIRASTRFDWFHGQSELLLEHIRNDIRHRVFQHNPVSFTEDRQAWLDTTEQITEMKREQIRELMSCPAPTQEQQWTLLIQQLQALRKAL